MSKCAEKYMKLTRRAGYRYAELNFGSLPADGEAGGLGDAVK